MQRRLPAIKWSVAIFLLCGLMATRLPAQSPVALSQYHAGMRWYFPDDSLKRVTRQSMPGYSHIPAGVVLYIPAIFETYDHLATKTYRLDSIRSRTTYDMFGHKNSTLCFVLVNEQGKGTGKDTLYYVCPGSNPRVLPGAILMDDVDDAAALYHSKHFYAQFAIAIGGKKLKYQEVVITDVSPGTVYGPVRIGYRVIDKGAIGSVGSVDVVTTGTNVLPVYWPGHLFTDYFQAAKPGGD